MAFIARKKEPSDITEQDMQYAIAVQSVWINKRYTSIIPNCYTRFDNEADLFAIRPSGLCDEIEIKVSKADFRLDESKSVKILDEANAKRRTLYNTISKRDALCNGNMSNYFWYAFPVGLIEHSDVPEWAGIIEVDCYLNAREVRKPKKLHKNKMTLEEQLKQIRKLGYRFWNMIGKNQKEGK